MKLDSQTLQILVAMVIYMTAVIVIGIVFAKTANKSSENYFLGGRSLGPWVTAMSAEASDMSGWLLMGLPGVAYWCGLADAAWTAIGLAIGTYLNWLIVSKRLRRYSIRVNAITLPEYFSNRFREKKKVILTLSALFILIFFTVYAASCFVTCGKLFSTLFGFNYISMMLVGAVFVLLYNSIFAVTFDEDFARATGTKAGLYNLLIAVVVAVIIVLAMNLVGSLLISALVIFPALSAMRVFKSFKAVTICSAALSVFCAFTGMLISILGGTPVGSTVVAMDMLAFGVFHVIGMLLARSEFSLT